MILFEGPVIIGVMRGELQARAIKHPLFCNEAGIGAFNLPAFAIDS
jgi:hypothetical protein